MSTHQHALQPGTRIDTFEIRTVLGAGGFGITYKAWDHQLECDVAIKEYLPSSLAVRDADQVTVSVISDADDDTVSYESGLNKFLDEARILARFKHPNLVGVKQFLSANGTAYMVMDYEQGSTLAQRFAKYPPPHDEKELRRLLERLLAGLSVLHENAILHRDIKPGNIYIREDGDPVLLDFGSARRCIAEHKTQEMTSMVTFGYAPHEQYHARGHQGPWTDLYSLGATVYYCATGEKPADGMERYLAVQQGDADPLQPVAEVAPALDATLAAVLDWMLRVFPDDRPRSVAQVGAALEGGPIPEPAPRPAPASEATQIVEPTVRIKTPRPAKTPPLWRKLTGHFLSFSRPLQLALAGGGVILALALLTPAAISAYTDQVLPKRLSAAAQAALGVAIEIDAVDASFLGREIQLYGLRIRNLDGYSAPYIIEAEALDLRTESFWWWTGVGPRFVSAQLSGLRIHHERKTRSGRSNLAMFLRELPQRTPPTEYGARIDTLIVKEGLLRATHPGSDEVLSKPIAPSELAGLGEEPNLDTPGLIAAAVRHLAAVAGNEVRESAALRASPTERRDAQATGADTAPAAREKPAPLKKTARKIGATLKRWLRKPKTATADPPPEEPEE